LCRRGNLLALCSNNFPCRTPFKKETRLWAFQSKIGTSAKGLEIRVRKGTVGILGEEPGFSLQKEQKGEYRGSKKVLPLGAGFKKGTIFVE